MSMISAQIDKLRERAKELRNLAPDPDVPYLVPSTKEIMALAMQSAASEMEDAADTIWQLRDDLQRANAENAKLRTQLADVTESMGRVEERCAKLRELAAGIGHLLFSLDVDYCVTCPRDGINHPCPAYTVDGGECLYKTDLRELGVEVE